VIVDDKCKRRHIHCLVYLTNANGDIFIAWFILLLLEKSRMNIARTIGLPPNAFLPPLFNSNRSMRQLNCSD
jgi:hypothetical protein